MLFSPWTRRVDEYVVNVLLAFEARLVDTVETAVFPRQRDKINWKFDHRAARLTFGYKLIVRGGPER